MKEFMKKEHNLQILWDDEDFHATHFRAVALGRSMKILIDIDEGL